MILAIDTATRWTGIALHDGNRILAEMGWRARNTQTVELAPSVGDMLRKTGVDAADLKAVAVAIGPGSYTGLRVGLGFAKGFALAHKLPLIGIDTLDIVVAAFGQDENRLVIVAEAGRKRVSAATYRWYSRKGWQVKESADNYEWEALLAKSKEGSRFAGEISDDAGKKIRAAEKGFKVIKGAYSARRAGHLAEIGVSRWKKGLVDDSAELTPTYLRDPAGAKPTS